MTRAIRALFGIVLLSLLLVSLGDPAFAQAASEPASQQSSGSSAGTRGAKPQQLEETDANDAYRHSASVKKIGGMMGLSPTQAATAFEVTNFVVLALLVGWLVLKSVPKLLRGRNIAIQKQLVDARSATEEASRRLKGVEDRLAGLDREIAAMRTQADQDSALDEVRIKAAVEAEKNKLIASAGQEIAAASSQAHREIQQYAAELAIEQAARRLVVSAETDRLLVQSFARRLGGDDSKEGQN